MRGTCRVVTDVGCAVGETPCLPRSDDPGFSIDEAEVTYWGPCPDLFHRPQFLSTMIRLVRKDSHV